jgi:high affinity sulfate transporter 1
MMNSTEQLRLTGWDRMRRFAPGLAMLRGYRPRWLRNDMAAGLSVAAIALPVGIAYAELAGVPAVFGIYSAIFPLFAYALFGSSRQLMTGPDAATCMLVAAALAPLAAGDPDRYLALMTVLTLMTGGLYVVAGMARLGFIANFLSLPILTGFLNGVALVIVVGQLPKIAGYESVAGHFFPRLVEFFNRIGQAQVPTLLLGLGALALLVMLRRLVPRVPAALIVVAAGITVVMLLGLEKKGVETIGDISAGLPSLRFPALTVREFGTLFLDAAGIVLISFTSGVLTAKSFARRNRYEIDANQEMIGFGACNLASGLAQGFPVTGADSRTAVNNAMDGKTQLVGIVAGGTMLAIVVFLADPLTFVPNTALAAVIIVSALGLFDFHALRELYESSRREFAISVGTTAGVLVVGVLPGVILAVGLSLLWLLWVGSRPHDAILGRVPGLKGFHDVRDYPDAVTIPGLVIYRFDANLIFYNADYFRDRLRSVIAASETPVEWVVVDASPINVVDFTAVQKFQELRAEFGARGIFLATARVKRNLDRFFKEDWIREQRDAYREYRFVTVKSAVRAFNMRKREIPNDG